METKKFYLDEMGCYTSDIKKAKALVYSKGVIVKPKCFVDANLKVVSDIKHAVAVVNAYKDDYLQIIFLQSGGPVTRRALVEKMCENTAKSYPESYGLIPWCPTNKTCLLANFMEKSPRIKLCHTLTDVVDKNGKIEMTRGSIKAKPMYPTAIAVKRNMAANVYTKGLGTKPLVENKINIPEDNIIRRHSHPAVLISLSVFEKINPDVNFLRDFLYFCE